MFIFTLHNNIDNRIQKFEQIEKVSTFIFDGDMFYRCGGDLGMRFIIISVGNCFCEMNGISKVFKGTSGKELIGFDCSNNNRFLCKRLIVIEMK